MLCFLAGFWSLLHGNFLICLLILTLATSVIKEKAKGATM